MISGSLAMRAWSPARALAGQGLVASIEGLVWTVAESRNSPLSNRESGAAFWMVWECVLQEVVRIAGGASDRSGSERL